MRILEEVKLSYNDVLICPKRSTLTSRKEVDLVKKYKFRTSKQEYIGVPIMASNMAGVGEGSMVPPFAAYGMIVCLKKLISFYEIPYIAYENFAITIGMSKNEIKYLEDYFQDFQKIKYICMDVANGYMEAFAESVAQVRALYPDKVIIAGNVVTGDMTQELLLAGADIVKVGIGSGAVCTTRLVAGVGYPQLSAVIECADAAHGLGGHIIADGGIVHPGDVAKAFGAGADFVMIGSMFAGYREGYKPQDIVLSGLDGKTEYIDFCGNSSKTAQNGDLKDYKASEGRTIRIRIKGSINDILQEIQGGLRSACTYAGARTLKDLPKCCTFIRTNQIYNSSQEQHTIGK